MKRPECFEDEYCEDFLSHEVADLLTEAGFPNLSLHSLRHTYMTKLSEMNYTARQAQIIIDHSNILTTTGYMHEKVMESPEIGI